jgi:hypothetical protein
MIKIAIILGSTRPNRHGEAVAKWVCEVAKTRRDAEVRARGHQGFQPAASRRAGAALDGGNTVSLTPKHGLRRLVLSMPTFLSRQSTTTELPARSRTQSIFCSLSGTTKRLDSLATAVLAGRARSSICVSFWRRCKWPLCVTRSCSGKIYKSPPAHR